MLQNLNYPLHFHFHISSFHNDFTLTDSNEQTLAYAKQKLFKFKEKVNVFTNKNQTETLFTIEASKWIDFNSAYEFKDIHNNNLGKVARKGWRSLWKTTYEIIDNLGTNNLTISEKNPWVKVFDSLLGEIPILSFFTGYLFNPTYNIVRKDGTIVAELKKDPSFFGRKFSLHKVSGFKDLEESQMIPSLMMMILLERRKG